jgi:hypothetical protein
MLSLTMLPARQGDCLWISYGDAKSPHHLVIDGGPERANVLRSEIISRIAAAPDRKLHIDLLVATHIDNDHIGGLLDVMLDFPAGLTIGDIWFNAYRHLPPDLLGVDQGERLTEVLDAKKLPWNEAFDRGAVMIPESGPLPERTRQDGLKLTLLGPGRAQLVRLGKVWSKAVLDSRASEGENGNALLGRNDAWPPDINDLAGKIFQTDDGAANGSSIAFLLSYEGKQILLAADAHAPVLARAIDRINGGERLELRSFKLSHHGSRKSTSTELLERVACDQYLISSNGSYFGHPDPEAIARVLLHGGRNPGLVFNYHGRFSSRWKDAIRGAPGFRTQFPAEGAQGVRIEF